MSTNNPPNAAGVIFIDDKGRIVFAAGVGRDPRLRTLIDSNDWMENARSHRLSAVELDRTHFAALLVPLAQAEMIVFHTVSADVVFEFIASVDFAYDIVHHMLTDPFNALTVVDEQAKLVYISPIHEEFFGIRHGEARGQPVRQVIPNTRLDHVVQTGKAEIGAIQRMRGAERIVSRTPIIRGGKTLGAIGRVMFKGPEQVETLNRQVNALRKEVEFYRQEAKALRRESYRLEDMLGDSPAIVDLRRKIAKIAPLDVPVLVTGESGTGKELVAHAIHKLSTRRAAPFVMVNAAALPASLVESELFGYEANSFTGADRKGRKGKFEQADKGTIFLDEIGDMPIDMQVKLLRVLQDRQIERLGSSRSQEIDFRLVTATNQNLELMIRDGRFRLDLFYRISGVVLEVPSLASRVEDIPILVHHFLRHVAERNNRPVPEIEPDVFPYLMDISWPGNIRQLRHAVERAFVFSDDRISRAHFIDFGQASFGEPGISDQPSRLLPPFEAPGVMKGKLEVLEIEMIRNAMVRLNGNKKRVAKELGISRSYLYKRLGEMS